MKKLLSIVAFIFGVAVSVRAQDATCSKDTPYPLYNFAYLTGRFLESVPLVPPLCDSNSVKEVVKFNCRTSGSDKYFTVDFENERTFNNKFNKKSKFFFIVHGWFGDCYHDWPLEMMDVLSEYEPINVCCVDWSKWAQCNYIPDAEIYVYQVADYLASIIKQVRKKFSVALNRFVLIGHSFGGQIIGLAGKHFPPPDQLPLGMALDPAGYLFTKPTEIPARRRLNATDFKVTKAIYTDKKGLGSAKPMAAINIYANKGEDQPNCDLDILPIGGQILPDVEVDMFPCSHFDANAFFIESMRKNQTHIYPIISSNGNRDHFTLYAKDVPGTYNLTTTECYPYTSPPLRTTSND